MKLYELLDDYITKNNMTYDEFCDKCGNLTKGYISLLITKKGINPKTNEPIAIQYPTYKALARGLGISVTELYSIIEDAPVDTLGIFGSSGNQRDINARLVELVDNAINEASHVRPNYNYAATKALDILKKHKVSALPVDPLALLKNTPNVLVVQFTELVDEIEPGLDNATLMFGADTQTATTLKLEGDTGMRIVAFNQRMPTNLVQVALARELGHAILKHDAHPDKVQVEEALCFARHLMCPRPAVRALQESGVTLNIDTIGRLTGLYGRALAGVRQTNAATAEAKKNRQVKALFADYISRALEHWTIVSGDEEQEAFDFGTFMDGYTE